MSASTAAVRTSRLTKIFGKITVLDDLDVEFERGHFTALMGPSGSGKSTLLHLLGGVDRPTSGKVWLGETKITGLDDVSLSTLRRDRIGFIFQTNNLMPSLTVAENIMLPLELAGRNIDQQFADHVLESMGLSHLLLHRPGHLSGLQRQRVSAARALIGKPDVVLADEPTATLDRHARLELLGLLRRGVEELGRTVIMVTHDPAAAAAADRVVFFESGRVATELRRPSAGEVMVRMDALRRRREALLV